MSKLILIACVCCSLFLGAQSSYEIERTWADNKQIVSSYKNPFQYVSDSVLVVKPKFKYSLAPELAGAYEKNKFSLLAGLQFVGLYDFSPKWNVKFSNRLLSGMAP